MKRITFLFIGITAVISLLAYGFDFQSGENSSGFSNISSSYATLPSFSPKAMVTESFDGATFPPTGWFDSALVGTTHFVRVTTGTYPTCSPHSGAGMSQFYSYTGSGNRAILVTPSFDLTSGQGQVSFWMYRDPGYSSNYDSIGVWVNTSKGLTGAAWLGNIWRYNATANWYQFTYTIPAGFNGATNYIIFVATSAAGDNMYIDDVSYGVPAPMVYTSSTTTQITGNVSRNSANNGIIGIPVTMSGALSPINITQINFTTTGSTNPVTDIANAKVYFTGSSSSFATGTQFGSTVISPNGSFSVTGTQTLADGTNYFWLSYDVSGSAVLSNYIDATCQSITGSGSMGTVVPTITAPPGNRQISAWFTESFDNTTFPPVGWKDTAIVGSSYLWVRSTAGTNPTCLPHSGAGMAYYNSYSSGSGNYAILVTPPFDLSAGQGQTSFWFYRDPGYSTLYDSIAVWVNTSPSLTGATPLGNIWRYNATAGWYQYTYNIPPGFNGTTNYLIYKAIGWAGDNMFLDDVSYGVPPPMLYTSSSTSQTNGSVVPNTTNNQIIGMQVLTTGSGSPLNITQFNLTTTGSSNPTTDIRNAKVFYTGLSNTFATTTQFGSAVTNPNGTFNISGTQALLEGLNYFWLTYDIPSGAAIGNVVDATCEQIIGSGTMGTVIPVPTAPAGNKTIAGPFSGTYIIGAGQTAPNYPNFSIAMSDLSVRGVNGPITFLVKPGIYGTDAGTEMDSVINIGPVNGSSAANTITFKKKSDEVGDVWVERRGTTGTSDYAIGLLGAKYTTFDSINIRQRDSVLGNNNLEWGYYITNPTGTTGSQYNIIRNCQIYLKGSNANTCGIWQYLTATPTLAIGTNSYNTYANNTIVNAYKGLELYGYSASSPYNLYDLGNLITGNNVLNMGSGGLASYAYGIYTYYQGNGLKILNNTISTAPNHAYYYYGITTNYGYDANVDINGNTISANYNSSYSVYGIYPYYTGALSSATTNNRVNINNNTFNFKLGSAYSTTLYGIYPYYCFADTLNIIGNKFVNDSIPGTGTAYLIYPYYWGNNLNVVNDTINNIYRISSGATYAIYPYTPNYNKATERVYNNFVNNIRSTSGSTYGIYSGPATTTSANIYNNIVSNLFTGTGSSLYGIYTSAAANNFVYGNKINGLKDSLYTSGVVYGIYGVSGTNNYFYNNFISNLRAQTSASNPGTAGFYISGGTYNGVFNNSIYLADTSTSASYGSNGVYLSSTYYTDVRNNNIVNISKPGNAGYTNKTSGIRIGSSTYLPYYLGTSNNNNIYTNPADTGSVIFFDGANRDFTLQSFKNRVTPRDQSSISTMPNYINAAAGDLHINTAIPTLIYNGASQITSPINVSTDIDGYIRSNPFCDIGASEFAGSYATDNVPPTIIYTPLGNANNTNRALNNVVVTDPSGINSTAAVWYKKSINANTFNDNTSATDGWKYAFGTVSGSTVNFTINYSVIYGGSVATSDTIQYFVTAQDNASTPNVGINAGVFATTPTSVVLAPANFPITGTINRYVILGSAIGSSVTVGTGGTYPTLTGAGGLFAAINTGVLNGNVTATIISDIIEPGTNQLQNWSEQMVAANYKIKIVPDGTTVRNLYGWVANGLIRLYGVNNVTIDGSYGGSGRYLKFVNRYASNTLYPTIQFTGGCTYDTLKNCIVEGNNTSTTSGVVLIGAAYTTNPIQANNNLTISGCMVSNRSDSLTGTVPAVGICNYGSAYPLPVNSNNNILNNEVKNFSSYGIYVSATGTGDGWVVKKNSVYYLQDAYTPAYTAVSMYAIYVVPGIYGSGYAIDSNYVGGSQALAGGSYMDIKGLYNGIYVTLGYNSVSSISGNVIKNIRSTYITANINTFYGMYCGGGWMNITGNYLGSADTAQRLQMNGMFRGIQASSAYFTGPATVNCTYNTLNNIWTRPDSTIATLTGSYNRYGIVAGGYIPVNCSNNTIMNLLNWQNPGATAYNVFTMGILPNIYSASTINNNIIYNVANMSTVAPTSTGRILTYGMQPIGMGDGSVFAGNRISHIYSSTPSGSGDLVMGIYNAASYYGSTVTLANNQVSLLDNAGAYANVMGVIDVSGSYNGGVCNWYDNSIVVGGTSGAGNPYNSYAYYKSTTVGIPCYTNMRNNILYNFRTGGNNNHLATGTYNGTKVNEKFPLAYNDEKEKPVIYNTPRTAGSPTFTSDYNFLVSSASNMIGDWYGALYNFSGWQTNSAGDLNSVTDTVANITAANLFKDYLNANLNIDTTKLGSMYVYKKGIGIAGITNDFNGYPRSVTGSVNIGSHEFLLNGNAYCNLISPANNSTGLQAPLNLVWSKALFATSYSLQVSADSTFATTTVNLIQTDSIYTFNSASPLTKYYWRVAPVYANGRINSYTLPYNFKVIGSPNQVTLLSPANGTIDLPTTVTFYWLKPTEQTFYKPKSLSNYWFEYTTDSSFATSTIDSLLTDTTKTISGLNTNKKYFWKVKAKNQNGWGTFSSVWNFTTKPNAPNSVVLISPPNNAINQPYANLTFIWSKAVETLDKNGRKEGIPGNSPKSISNYWFELATDTGFTAITSRDSSLADTTKTIATLSSNVNYYWRVKAKNQTGWGSFSTVFTFRTTLDPTYLAQANFVSVITPQIMGSGNTTRLPVVIRATVINLVPNKLYRFYNGGAAFTDLGTGAYGAGNSLFMNPDSTNYRYTTSVSLVTSGGYDVFRANGSGAYTGWFAFVNTGNARFTSGKYIIPSIQLGDSVGTLIARYALNDSIKVTGFNTLSADTCSTGIYGISYGLPKNIISLYDNTGGTGRPLSQTYLEDEGVTVASIAGFYSTNVNAQNGRWGTLIPNNNPNGVRRVEQRDRLTGNSISFNTSSAGLWPSGTNTVNPAGGTTALALLINDAPLFNSPVLVTPANGTVDLTTTPALTWNSVATAGSYRVQVSTDSTFAASAFDSTGFTGITITVPSGKLSTNMKYYWRVNATNIVGTSAWSTLWNFTTAPNAPNVPILATPINGAINQPVNLSFNWYKAIETLVTEKSGSKNKETLQTDGPKTISRYWFEMGTDSTFGSVVLRDTARTDTTASVSSLNNNTRYFWRVKAKNQTGWGAFSATWNFTTIPTVPASPTLVSPTNNSLDITLTPTLVWNSVATANTYRVQVSTSNTFGTTVLDSALITGLQITVPAGKLTTNTKYYWRVCATNAAGTGSYSAVWNFTTYPNAPNAPLLYAPANNSTGLPTTVTCVWYKSVETLVDVKNSKGKENSKDELLTISKYWFEYSTDSTFSTIIARDSSLTDSTKTLTGLTNGTKYFWRVKAKNQTGWGNFSAVWNFRIVSLSISLNLKAYLEGFWDGTQQVSDTVTVYLANPTTPFAFVDTAKVVLSTTGTASNIMFNRATPGNYYIVVNHRNHLETWSKLPQTFVGGTPLSYDFTTAATQAFGDNMKQVGSDWVFFGGDANQDGSIDGFDIVVFVPQYGTQGYLSADFNGDGDVTAADVIIISANYGLTKAIPTLNTIFNPPSKQKLDMNEVMKKVNSNKDNVKQSPTGNKKNTGSDNVKKQNKK